MGPMSSIRVEPASLQGAAGQLRAVGGDIQGLVGAARTVAGSACDPPATAASLEAFGTAWAGGLERLAAAVEGLGTCTAAAATLYTQADQLSMPAP